ncbi:MAG: type II toxin-antitoxin system RelE/ParE family toxin, partial [Acidobacteria bacterium]|nr:type II toxin-antitoxin system RelE/ParE family toxin [Acidobacteriota bacterium]
LVKGLGGARKARVADPNKKGGKSGGFRYLYLYLELRGRIHLLYLYSKREQSDLSDDQRKQISALVEILKKAGRKK